MSVPTAPTEKRIRLAAVGDILLDVPPDGAAYPRDPRLLDDRLRRLLADCDLVFGNLECTLRGNGEHVPTEPRVVATPELVRQVKTAGFDVVTLANNHAFDCLDGGFLHLRRTLAPLQLPHFGAGMTLAEATAPAIVEQNGLRVAMLGAVDARSGPYQFATDAAYGVAPLDLERLTAQIRRLRPTVDHVIVSVHWGEERFFVPAPDQMAAARTMVAAGATLVLGHHPHVLQGMEIVDGAPIVYSLGNFVADEVHFSDGDAIQWNRAERTGGLLVVDLEPDKVANVEILPTYDTGRLVELDTSRFGHRRIASTARAIARGVSAARYRRERLWVRLIKPSLERLRWSKLVKLRPRHFARAFEILRGK